MDWTLPPNLAAGRMAIDETYYIILVLTAIAFVLVELGILWFIFRYRDREADYIHGNNTAEIIWTAIPAIAMVWLGLHSGGIWSQIKGEQGIPDDAFDMGVTARQFEWMVTYPGVDGELGTPDDFTLRNDVRIPVSRAVSVNLHTEDVIHSFFLPFMRVKQDAVPGMTTRTWFEAAETGDFQLACAELCGLGHYRMSASVAVLPADSFRTWYEARAKEAAAEADSSFWSETPPNTPETVTGLPDDYGATESGGEGSGEHQ